VVVFGLTNTGPAATSQLSAFISLPPGTAMMGGWHTSHRWHGSHRHHARPGRADAAGWTCRAVTGGAACTHGPIAAAARAGSLLAVWVTGPAACGQHVQVRVTSGASSVTARSAEPIWCGHS
jgi:hypothetical protein